MPVKQADLVGAAGQALVLPSDLFSSLYFCMNVITVDCVAPFYRLLIRGCRLGNGGHMQQLHLCWFVRRVFVSAPVLRWSSERGHSVSESPHGSCRAACRACSPGALESLARCHVLHATFPLCQCKSVAGRPTCCGVGSRMDMHAPPPTLEV